MSDRQPQPGPLDWGPPPAPADPWWGLPPSAQPRSLDPPPGAAIQQPPPSKHRSWITWVIALAAFGAGLAVGTAGTHIAPQAIDPQATASPPPGSAAPTLTDGVYEVRVEIMPGTYKTRAPKGNRCYWARLADPTGDVIFANHGGTGPMTLQVRSIDKFVELRGGCAWRRVG